MGRVELDPRSEEHRRQSKSTQQGLRFKYGDTVKPDNGVAQVPEHVCEYDSLEKDMMTPYHTRIIKVYTKSVHSHRIQRSPIRGRL